MREEDRWIALSLVLMALGVGDRLVQSESTSARTLPVIKGRETIGSHV